MLKQKIWFYIATASHLVVDMCCACLIAAILSASHSFASVENQPAYLLHSVFYLLLYNFCAFALQMPIGYLADLFCQKKQKKNTCTLHSDFDTAETEGIAAFGCLLVALPFFFLQRSTATASCYYLSNSGSVTLAVISAGIGNALFHIGAGREVLKHTDGKMKYAGIFVSSGALGLYLGGKVLLSQKLPIRSFCVVLLILAAIALCSRRLLLYLPRKAPLTDCHEGRPPLPHTSCFLHWCYPVIFVLFITVVLRSLMGMILSFSWTASVPGIISCLLLVFGKALGGILADHFGIARTMTVTLGLSAIFFLLSQQMIFGMLAILLFQTTMPITLWLLYEQMPKYPGFAFGILTFGLFIGYLPYWFGIHTILQSPVIYALIALLSLGLLFCALRHRAK